MSGKRSHSMRPKAWLGILVAILALASHPAVSQGTSDSSSSKQVDSEKLAPKQRPTRPATTNAEVEHPVQDEPQNERDIAALKDQVSKLRDQQQQDLAARANSTINFANVVVQWSAVFLTAVAIMVALVGVLGFREVQAIRRRSREIENL